MKEIFNHTNILDVINDIPEGIHTYYNKKYRRFEYHYEDDLGSNILIKAPCSYEMKREFLNTFYSLLNKQEYNVAKSYPFKRGYFDYLKEVGLYEIYEEAEYLTKVKKVLVWMIKNNIPMGSKPICIDCRYL